MRGTRAVPGALVAAALAVTGLSGCLSSAPPAATDTAGASATAAPPSGYGSVFLADGECSSLGTTSFTEVPCTSAQAAARVIARHDGDPARGPACPATTDVVLHIGRSAAAPDATADGATPQGYACMRNLRPPHPGDPGGGGGPRTIVGDCVYGAGAGEVRETSCDGKGAHAPQYKVTSAVARRSQCPSSTGLYVELGGARPVGCARSLTHRHPSPAATPRPSGAPRP
ncbi:hypothetical protein AB0C59_13715 [Streptomyces sp. NPDC048664]|uniref:hypothetical protein n=1 Tax=Streptomyces sp. NPDC048664 TaxID=3154505 RepID=UPI0034138224